MKLVVGTVLWVVVVTVLIAVVGFVLDRTTTRQEAGRNDPKE
jgi:hypothetical protein